MKNQKLNWKTKDGINIYGQYWKTDQPEKAVITLVHGFGEHCDRYHHVAEMFCNNGYSVISYDQRGHGQSGGQRGHTPTYEMLLSDVDILMQKAKDIFPDAPVIIYGHSMGGNVVTNYIIDRQPNVIGGIVTGPFYRTTSPPPAFQMFLGKIMQNIYGAFPDKAKLDVNHISRDKDVVRKYDNDPTVHNKISAKMGISLIEFGEKAIEQASKVKIPFYILHGEADLLTDVNGSKDFKRNAGDNVTLETFPVLYHELHNEPEKDMIFEKLIAFCNQLV